MIENNCKGLIVMICTLWGMNRPVSTLTRVLDSTMNRKYIHTSESLKLLTRLKRNVLTAQTSIENHIIHIPHGSFLRRVCKCVSCKAPIKTKCLHCIKFDQKINKLLPRSDISCNEPKKMLWHSTDVQFSHFRQ